MNKEFQLKNQYTTVSAEKSISDVERLLTTFGATAIMKEYYTDGRCRALMFRIGLAGYKIPVNDEGVKKCLWIGRRTSRVNGLRSREEQAYRVAWRIIKDWVHSQLSIVKSGQASTEEVLLAYMFDGKRTLYQAYTQGALQIEGKNINEETVIRGENALPD